MEFLRSILKFFTDNDEVNRQGFFATFFKTTEEDYTDTETVEIDIERDGQKVAPVIKDARTGSVIVSADDFSTKEYKPPLVSLTYPADLYDLMQRQPGEKDTAGIGSWLGRLFNKLKKEFLRMHKMVQRNIELQAAQILQTGSLTLEDEDTKEAYVLNYPVKRSHFPTVTTAWTDPNAKPLDDLEALCDAIVDDGRRDVSVAIFGSKAWNNALRNADFVDKVKRDGIGMGSLNPGLKNRGGRYMGYMDIGTHRLELWCYNDSYQKLGNGTNHRYMDPDKVIVTAAQEDLDFRGVYGGVPTLGMQEPFKAIVPSELKYAGGMRVHNRVYHDAKGDTYNAETKSRPLLIPVSIDRFGCLKTTV